MTQRDIGNLAQEMWNKAYWKESKIDKNGQEIPRGKIFYVWLPPQQQQSYINEVETIVGYLIDVNSTIGFSLNIPNCSALEQILSLSNTTRIDSLRFFVGSGEKNGS